MDCVTENSSKEETDDLLLEKENFWIETLCTIHNATIFNAHKFSNSLSTLVLQDLCLI